MHKGASNQRVANNTLSINFSSMFKLFLGLCFFKALIIAHKMPRVANRTPLME
ncbi:hypothetical protein HPNQ4110_0388 [Helicobacter pylori NQ4110]|nr:hypothetical protein HPNQ4110_0388 [Helicobacter pylori NQ4110]